MVKVKLYTEDGQFVVAGEIFPFHRPPDVLFWGQRVFCFSHRCGDALEYHEAFYFTLLSELVEASA